MNSSPQLICSIPCFIQNSCYQQIQAGYEQDQQKFQQDIKEIRNTGKLAQEKNDHNHLKSNSSYCCVYFLVYFFKYFYFTFTKYGIKIKQKGIQQKAFDQCIQQLDKTFQNPKLKQYETDSYKMIEYLFRDIVKQLNNMNSSHKPQIDIDQYIHQTLVNKITQFMRVIHFYGNYVAKVQETLQSWQKFKQYHNQYQLKQLVQFMNEVNLQQHMKESIDNTQIMTSTNNYKDHLQTLFTYILKKLENMQKQQLHKILKQVKKQTQIQNSIDAISCSQYKEKLKQSPLITNKDKIIQKLESIYTKMMNYFQILYGYATTLQNIVQRRTHKFKEEQIPNIMQDLYQDIKTESAHVTQISSEILKKQLKYSSYKLSLDLLNTSSLSLHFINFNNIDGPQLKSLGKFIIENSITPILDYIHTLSQSEYIQRVKKFNKQNQSYLQRMRDALTVPFIDNLKKNQQSTRSTINGLSINLSNLSISQQPRPLNISQCLKLKIFDKNRFLKLSCTLKLIQIQDQRSPKYADFDFQSYL